MKLGPLLPRVRPPLPVPLEEIVVEADVDAVDAPLLPPRGAAAARAPAPPVPPQLGCQPRSVAELLRAGATVFCEVGDSAPERPVPVLVPEQPSADGSWRSVVRWRQFDAEHLLLRQGSRHLRDVLHGAQPGDRALIEWAPCATPAGARHLLAALEQRHPRLQSAAHAVEVRALALMWAPEHEEAQDGISRVWHEVVEACRQRIDTALGEGEHLAVWRRAREVATPTARPTPPATPPNIRRHATG